MEDRLGMKDAEVVGNLELKMWNPNYRLVTREASGPKSCIRCNNNKISLCYNDAENAWQSEPHPSPQNVRSWGFREFLRMKTLEYEGGMNSLMAHYWLTCMEEVC